MTRVPCDQLYMIDREHILQLRPYTPESTGSRSALRSETGVGERSTVVGDHTGIVRAAVNLLFHVALIILLLRGAMQTRPMSRVSPHHVQCFLLAVLTSITRTTPSSLITSYTM